MPTTKKTAALIERRRSAYETAKKALIAACAAHLRTIADDPELCAAIAHRQRVPAADIIEGLRTLSVQNTDVDDSHNSFGESHTYGASISTFVPDGKRLLNRWARIRIPLETVQSPAKYAAWRAEKIGATEAERRSKARELCRERRELNSAIEALPPELQRIALGKKV